MFTRTPELLATVACLGAVRKHLKDDTRALYLQDTSTVAFIAAFVPSTIALLIVEMKLLAGRLQADVWTFPTAATGARR